MASRRGAKQLQQDLNRRQHGLQQLQRQLRQFAKQHLQTTLQLPIAVALTGLIVFIRPITFPLACLSGVFVVVLHLLLVRDHHVGTLLLSSFGLLGAVWSGIAAAGVLVSITLQIPSRAGHLMVATVVASLGFGLVAIVKVSNQPFRVTLQATNMLMAFGMSVVLSLWAPSTLFLWRYFLGHMLLSFLGAALASGISGLLVLPSLATEAAMEAVITALRRTGQTGTMCVSILLRPDSGPEQRTGEHVSQQQRQQQQQQHQIGSLTDASAGVGRAFPTELGRSTTEYAEAAGSPGRPGSNGGGFGWELQREPDGTDRNTAGVATDAAAAAAAAEQGQGPAVVAIEQQPSLLEEIPEGVGDPAEEMQRMQRLTQPGHWGLKSFISAAHSRSSITAGTAGSGDSRLALQDQQQQQRTASLTAASAKAPGLEEEEQDSDAAVVAAVEAEADNEYELDDELDHEHDDEVDHEDLDWRQSLLSKLHLPSLASFHLPQHRRHPHHKRSPSSVSLKKHHHQQQQQPEQPPMTAARREAERHLFLRLGRGVDHIRPLLLEARLLRESLVVEQVWWVRWLTSGPAWHACQDPRQAGVGPLPVASWVRLVEALSGLLDRAAALEGMLDAGPDGATLASLASYPTLRTTCGVVFAQVAALCAALSTALQQHLDQRRWQQQGPLVGLIRALANCCCCRQGRPRSHKAAGGAVPTLLGFCWSGSKQELLQVLHRETQQYYAALAAAGPSKPFKLDPARSVVSLMFLSTLTLAVIDAAEKLQEAGQAVLYGTPEGTPGASPAAAADSTATRGSTAHSPGHLGAVGGSTAASGAADGAVVALPNCNTAAAAPLGAASDSPVPAVQVLSIEVQHLGIPGPTASHANGDAPAPATAPTQDAAGRGAPSSTQPGQHSSSSSKAHNSSSSSGKPVARLPPGPLDGNELLLQVLLCEMPFKRIGRALGQELPAALGSRQGLRDLLARRRFQAGVKLWMACSVALVAADLLAVYTPGLPPSVAMFGFMALVFTMRERVESSTEMVFMRVSVTVIGACIGHALMFNAATAYQPALLGALLCLAALVTPPFAAGQYRLMLTLLIITLNSMILCQYVGCCGGVGSLTYFVGRILATGGGCLFAMVLNRLLWPWYRNRWALEEMAEILELGVAATAGMYHHEYKNVADLAAAEQQQLSNTNNSSSGGGASQAVDSSAVHEAAVRCSRDALLAGHAASSTEAVQQYGSGHMVVQPNRRTASSAGDADSPRDVVIHIRPAEWMGSGTAAHDHHHQQGQHSSQEGKQQQAAQVNRCQQLLQHQSPQQLLQRMMGQLAPVEFAVQRDTWLPWKRGVLAVSQEVRVMLAAVHHLADALSALRVTMDLTPQQQPRHGSFSLPKAHPAAAAGAPPSAAGSFSAWYSWLLFDQLASLVHGDISNVLQELGQLVELVQLVLRQPTEQHKLQLQEQIAAIHEMRVAFSVKYVKLRNQRHRRLRQMLKQHQAPQQQHSQQGQQQQQQQSQLHLGGAVGLSHRRSIRVHHLHPQQQHHAAAHGKAASSMRSPSSHEESVLALALAAAVEGVHTTTSQSQQRGTAHTQLDAAGSGSNGLGSSSSNRLGADEVAVALAADAMQQSDAASQQAAAAPAAAMYGSSDGVQHAGREVLQVQPAGPHPGQQQQQQQQRHSLEMTADQDLATLQYMSFVYALRRVINRALAVARCLEDYTL